jgi:uncharacterized protein YcbK (DUF882 family)
MQPTYASSHFTWSELTAGMTRLPKHQSIVDNMVRLTKAVAPYRNKIGLPWRVTSGYRPEEVNAAIGGAQNSYHVSGMAMDFYVDGMHEKDVFRIIDKDWEGGLGLYDRGGNGWIHIDIGPNRRWSQ